MVSIEQEKTAKNLNSNLIGKLGLLLFGLSLLALALTFFPIIKNEVYYSLGIVGTGSMKNDQDLSKPNRIVAADESFSIVVPKIGANSKVIENVDPLNSQEYQVALSKGVAHAKGTPNPFKALREDSGNTFLFAHSSDSFFTANQYNSIFYLLSKLEIGDVFYIVYDKQIFKYSVTEKSVVSADEIKYMETLDGYNNPTTTLMTCWPAGTTARRLVIVGEMQK